MSFMQREREALDRLVPGLDEELRQIAFEQLESPDNPAIEIFKKSGGAALLLPERLGGMGKGPLEAVRVHRAIGSRAPSLGVILVMHNFSLAGFTKFHVWGAVGEKMFCRVAETGALIASGFAEGRPGSHILKAAVTVERCEGGYILNGSKKPCTLSESMDILTAGINVPTADGTGWRRAMIVLPATTEGLSTQSYWKIPVLNGTESNELLFKNVYVPDEMVLLADEHKDDVGALNDLETYLMIWFQLLASASYLGIASALLERVLQASRGEPGERVNLAIEQENAMTALEGLAMRLATERATEALCMDSYMVRFAVQRAIERTVSRALELLGGMAFVEGQAISYLHNACMGLSFHPVGRYAATPLLCDYLSGNAA